MPSFEILSREPDIRSFKQGETIFNAGDTGDCMYAVVEGAVDIDIAGSVIERVTPVGVFGEMALIDHQPRSATALAAADCRVAVISEKRFLRLVEQTPRFALQIMQLIAERLRRARSVHRD
jgi:CRP-like cAMP-binding protein